MRGSLVERSGFANSPPKLGGVDAHQRKIAKPPLLARPGWFPKPFWNHPVCAVSEWVLLLSGAATPPNLGGEFLLWTVVRLPTAAFLPTSEPHP